MSMPEFVVQKGVRLAWDFISKNDYILGHDLRELPTKRQEEYRNLLRSEKMSIGLGYPTQSPKLPSISIVLSHESEDSAGQFVGDEGPLWHANPVPSTSNERAWAMYEDEEMPDFRKFESFEGVFYHEGDPHMLGVDGAMSTTPVALHPKREKNKWQQRGTGTNSDEQFEKMGHVARLWNPNTHKMSMTAVGDRASVDIIIATSNGEKTMVYFRLLRRVLRQFKTWFEINNVIDPVFSGGDISPDETLTPTSGITAYRRSLNMNFLHFDFSFEVASVIESFMIEVDMATRKQDGGLDFTRVTTIEGDLEEE
jgi:hypothetical protein